MMLKRLGLTLGALAIVGMVALLLSTAVLAQSGDTGATATPQATPAEPDGGRGSGGGFGFGCFGSRDTTSFDAVAEVLGLSPTQLFEQLHGGKTIDEVAQAQGVDIQKVKDAISAARTEAIKAQIAQAVEDGRMTQAQADWLLQ